MGWSDIVRVSVIRGRRMVVLVELLRVRIRMRRRPISEKVFYTFFKMYVIVKMREKILNITPT